MFSEIMQRSMLYVMLYVKYLKNEIKMNITEINIFTDVETKLEVSSEEREGVKGNIRVGD